MDYRSRWCWETSLPKTSNSIGARHEGTLIPVLLPPSTCCILRVSPLPSPTDKGARSPLTAPLPKQREKNKEQSQRKVLNTFRYYAPTYLPCSRCYHSLFAHLNSVSSGSPSKSSCEMSAFTSSVGIGSTESWGIRQSNHQRGHRRENQREHQRE